MVNVLVIGATGYVGSSAVGHLFRAGNHEVFGLAGTAAAGDRLAAQEIIPLVGKATDGESVADLVRRGKIDIIVDISSFNDASLKPTIFKAVLEAGQQLLASHTRKRPAKKLGFITVTGIWSHGSTEDPGNTFEAGRAGSNLTNPPDGLVEAREEYEDSVLAANDVLDVAVIRPAFIFGRGGSSWTKVLAPLVAARVAQPDRIYVPVTPRTFVNFVNIDDLGSAVEKAVNRLHEINGTSVSPHFEISSDRFDLQDLLFADARLFGCKGTVIQQASNDSSGNDGGDGFLRKIGRTDDMNSSKARTVLGWHPQRPVFVPGTHVYANSFLAKLRIAEEERLKGGETTRSLPDRRS